MIITGTAGVVVEPPPPPPPPVVQPPIVPPPTAQGIFTPLSWRWDSWTGATWELTSPVGPVTKLKGATGLDMPPVAHVFDDYPAVDGAGWQSARIPSREVLLPVMVHAYDAVTMRHARREFLRTLNPHQLNTLVVTSYDASARYLDLRYVDGGDSPIELDPQASARAIYPLVFTAEKPYWRGDVMSYSYQAPGTSASLFPGPPFDIGRGLTIDTAAVTNPGDLAAWPVWTIYGPFTSFTVGVGNALVSVSVTKSPGEYVTVDTTPGVRRVVDESGANLLGSLTAATFAPIPAGVDGDLALGVLGSSSVSAVELKFTPLYWTAW